MVIYGGMRIWFEGESKPYRVRAFNESFIICTKPFNPKRTVLYTVVDRRNKIRGTENLVFGFGAETDDQCEEMLQRVSTGETEISHRNRVPLVVIRCDGSLTL